MYYFFNDTVLYYLREMLVIAVPAAITFICFWPYRKKSLDALGLRTSPLREVGCVAFVMFLFGVLAVTLWPIYMMKDTPGLWGDVLLVVGRPSLLTNVNLIPFRMFADYWKELRQGGWTFTLLNLLGNLAVFMPLGFFPALLWRGETWRRSALVGCGVSVFVEIGQYFLMRSTDIDDVILNTLGALCGFWLFLLLRRLAPKFTAAFKCRQLEVPDGRDTGDTAAP